MASLVHSGAGSQLVLEVVWRRGTREGRGLSFANDSMEVPSYGYGRFLAMVTGGS